MLAIENPSFLISVVCMSDVLGCTVSLSRLLQKPTLDLKQATEALEDTRSILHEKRKNAESIFENLFYEVKEIAEQLGVELKKPRTCSRQTLRTNPPTDDSEEYFRETIYEPLLDAINLDLQCRLSPNVLGLFNLRVLLPKTSIEPEDEESLKQLVIRYQDFIGSVSYSVVRQEYSLWVQKWKRERQNNQPLPETVLDALKKCDEEMYPTIRIFLKILAALSISVASSERSFSTLRRLKNWLRASMGEERFNVNSF